jgi:hypothetical protein
MALSQYCTRADVLAQAPQFDNDSIFGTLTDAQIDEQIEEATTILKPRIAARYALSVIDTEIAATNLSVVAKFVAIRAALFLFEKFGLGGNAESALADLRRKEWRYEQLILEGRLLTDADVKVPTINDPSITKAQESAGLSESLEEVFADGVNRLGDPPGTS